MALNIYMANYKEDASTHPILKEFCKCNYYDILREINIQQFKKIVFYHYHYYCCDDIC